MSTLKVNTIQDTGGGNSITPSGVNDGLIKNGLILEVEMVIQLASMIVLVFQVLQIMELDITL